MKNISLFNRVIPGTRFYKKGIGSPEATTNTETVQQQVTLQGGGADSTTIGTGAGSTNNITVTSADPAVVQSAFQFGSEAQTIAGQEVGQANATIEQIAGQLAQLTANATPQTAAAVTENTAATVNPTVKILGIGGLIVAGLYVVSQSLKGGRRA